MDHLLSLKVVELKNKCRELQIPVYGTKNQLIRRIAQEIGLELVATEPEINPVVNLVVPMVVAPRIVKDPNEILFL